MRRPDDTPVTAAEPRRWFPLLVGHKREERERRGEIIARRSVPWALVEPHEARARKNHGNQTLERLAERGGLGYRELLAVLCEVSYYDLEPLRETTAEALVEVVAVAWERLAQQLDDLNPAHEAGCRALVTDPKVAARGCTCLARFGAPCPRCLELEKQIQSMHSTILTLDPPEGL